MGKEINNILKKCLCILLVCILVISSCACQKKEKVIDQVVIGTTMEIGDAYRGNYNFDMLASGTAEPPIIGRDAATGEYYPVLCNWETDDSRTWKLKVIDDMKWADGEKLVARDIEFAMKAEGKFDDVVDEYQFDENDDSVLNIVLKTANIRFIDELTTIRPLPFHQALGTWISSDLSTSIGPGSKAWCGPYRLLSYYRNSQTIEFVKNEFWPYQDQLKPEKIVFQLFGSEDTMYMALMNGDIDAVWNYSGSTPKSYIDIIKEKLGEQVLIPVEAANLPAVLCFNNSSDIFSNTDLRLAISYALDYSQFSEYLSAYKTSNGPRRGVASNACLGYSETPVLSRDLAEFEKYMGQAGYIKDASGKYVDGSGKALSFTLTVNSAKQNHVDASEIVKTQLESLGIGVETEILDSTAYNAKTSNKFSENHISFEAALMGFTAAGMNMGSGLGSIYVDGTHAVQGACQVYSAEFSEILSKMASAATVEDYCVYAKELQDFYAEYCPLIPLYWDTVVYATGGRLGGFFIDANLGLNNIKSWSQIKIQ